MGIDVETLRSVDKLLPLCVDLDGTLVKTDMLFECLVLFCRQRWWHFLLVLAWLAKGKAHLKAQLARVVVLHHHEIPVSSSFIEWLKGEKTTGRKLVLVTASNQSVAQMMADRVNLFDEVYGSDGSRNLKSRAKAAFLVERFGAQQFDYAGNASADWPVWQIARKAIVVNPTRWVKQRLKKLTNLSHVFEENQRSVSRSLFKALRVHQYAKNALILVPLFVSHSFVNLHLVMTSLLGLIAFCLLASCAYLINDLLDLDSDRRHARKRHRPIAAGDLSIPTVLGLLVLLMTAVMSFSLMLPSVARWVLLIYFAMTLAYSLVLKKLLLIDVCVLAGLYTIRIIYGATILQTPLTEWLLLFSMFSFLSLAFLKRFTELLFITTEQPQQLIGRGYKQEHTLPINLFGVVSGFLAALVFALYLNSENAQHLYHHPQALWLICPLIIYWISRIWLLASERKVHEDPIEFAIKDKVSYIMLLLVVIIGVFAYV